MQNYEKITMSKRQIIVNNFLGGIAWGLGATIGLAILLTIIGFAISKIDWIPIVGNTIYNGFNQALKNNPGLR